MKKVIPLLLVLFFLLIPTTAAFAVQTDPSALLSGSGGGLVPQCEGPVCRACDLVELANNVINFSVAFSVIVGALMFAYAGILYVTAAGKGPEQIKKAHQVLVNIFVGLCIVLLAWLLVDIGFSVLSGKGLKVWSHIDCVANPVTGAFGPISELPAGQTSSGSTAGGAPVTTALPSSKLHQKDALYQLQQAGVCGGATPCLDGGSLEGIKAKAIAQLIEIHKACGCQFTITSGVRLGDAHSTGFKLDLRTNNRPLDTFLKSLDPSPKYYPKWDPGRTSATVYTDGCGNRYALEKPVAGSSSGAHWDINAIGSLCSF